MISPFKAIIGDDYKTIEQRLLHAIHLRFGLVAETPITWKKRIKRADRIAAFFEATRLAGFGESEAIRFFGNPGKTTIENGLIQPHPPGTAQQAFLRHFHEIEAMRGAK